ncbi:hypothetical protein D3C86_1811850 [compost metagenome]
MHADERAAHIERALTAVLAIHAGDDHSERAKLVGAGKGIVAAHPVRRFRSRAVAENGSECKHK